MLNSKFVKIDILFFFHKFFIYLEHQFFFADQKTNKHEIYKSWCTKIGWELSVKLKIIEALEMQWRNAIKQDNDKAISWIL